MTTRPASLPGARGRQLQQHLHGLGAASIRVCTLAAADVGIAARFLTTCSGLWRMLCMVRQWASAMASRVVGGPWQVLGLLLNGYAICSDAKHIANPGMSHIIVCSHDVGSCTDSGGH